MGAVSEAPPRLLVVCFLYFFAYMGAGVVFPLVVVKRENDKCAADDDDACASRAAEILVIYGLASSVPQLLVSAFLGRVCDRRGARPVLALASLGLAVNCAAFVPFVLYDWPYWTAYAAAGVSGLSGCYTAVVAATFAYATRAAAARPEDYAPLSGDDALASDAAPATDAPATGGFRGIWVSLTISVVVAPGAAGVAAQAVGDAAVFAAAAFAALLAVAWIAFLLPPDVVTDSPQKAKRGDVVHGLKLLAKPGTRSVAIAWALLAANNVGCGNVAIQYLGTRMSTSLVGIYISGLGASAFLGNLVMEPLVGSFIKDTFRRDLWLARFGPLASMCTFLGFALVPVGPLIFSLLIFPFVVGAADAATRAVLVATQSGVDSGAALGGLGAVETLAALVTPVWLGILYSRMAAEGRPAETWYPLVGTAAIAAAILLFTPPYPAAKTAATTTPEAVLAEGAIA